MGDLDEPQPLLTKAVPTPMHKSTLPGGMGDPLLRLTPQKPVGLSHLKHRGVRVERHVATGVLIDERTNNIGSKQKRTTEMKDNVQTSNTSTNKTKTSAHKKYAKENAKKSASSKVEKNVRMEEPCVLQQPQCHSTAIVGHHLDLLYKEQFHGDTAVTDALRQSEKVRVNFAEKISEGVNRPVDERKYSGLIAVDVPIAETIAQAREEKITKVKGAPSSKKSSKMTDGPVPDILDVFSPDMIVEKPSFDVSDGPVPDILDVFSPDMIVEKPSFDVSTLQQQVIELEKAPDDMAFNLYKHMRCWQST